MIFEGSLDTRVRMELRLHNLTEQEKDDIRRIVGDGVITDEEMVEIMSIKIPGLMIYKPLIPVSEYKAPRNSRLHWAVRRNQDNIAFALIVGGSILAVVLSLLFGG